MLPVNTCGMSINSSGSGSDDKLALTKNNPAHWFAKMCSVKAWERTLDFLKKLNNVRRKAAQFTKRIGDDLLCSNIARIDETLLGQQFLLLKPFMDAGSSRIVGDRSCGCFNMGDQMRAVFVADFR